MWRLLTLLTLLGCNAKPQCLEARGCIHYDLTTTRQEFYNCISNFKGVTSNRIITYRCMSVAITLSCEEWDMFHSWNGGNPYYVDEQGPHYGKPGSCTEDNHDQHTEL